MSIDNATIRTPYLRILKRVGRVLFIVGVIEIALTDYFIAHRISYWSSLNILAMLAGIFLVRGSIQAASIVRWLAAFHLPGFFGLLIVFLLLQPLSLTLTQFRLNPGTTFLKIAIMAFHAGLLVWLIKELGREPIKAALIGAGKKQNDLRLPAGVGVAVVIVTSAFLVFQLSGNYADVAKFRAEQRVGPGYQFQVTSLNIVKNNEGTSIAAVVTVWNDREIREIPVDWQEW